MSAHALAIFCGITGALGLAAGVALLILPERPPRERALLTRWFFELNLAALLDQRQSVERPLYRHHRLFGAAVIVGAVALFATLRELRDYPLVAGVLSAILGTELAETMILMIWPSALFALGIGVFLFIRPSSLKRFEAAANRWIEPFPSSSKTRAPAATGISGLILRAPRSAALLLLTASLVCLLAFGG
jgi:hypothetical protein